MVLVGQSSAGAAIFSPSVPIYLLVTVIQFGFVSAIKRNIFFSSRWNKQIRKILSKPHNEIEKSYICVSIS
jgi:hypothetical protein